MEYIYYLGEIFRISITKRKKQGEKSVYSMLLFKKGGYEKMRERESVCVHVHTHMYPHRSPIFEFAFLLKKFLIPKSGLNELLQSFMDCRKYMCTVAKKK